MSISCDLSVIIRDRHAPLETVLEEVVGQPFVLCSKGLEILRKEAVRLVDLDVVLCRRTQTGFMNPQGNRIMGQQVNGLVANGLLLL